MLLFTETEKILTRPGHGGKPFILALWTEKRTTVNIDAVAVNRALFHLFALILRNVVRKLCGSCKILTKLNRSLRNSIRSSFSIFGDGRLVGRRNNFQIIRHAERTLTIWHRRAMVVENNGGCGVSVLLWFDGEEGDAQPTVPHPLSRAHERYRCYQCSQRYGRGGRYSDAASFSRQKHCGPRVNPRARTTTIHSKTTTDSKYCHGID